MSPKIPHQRTTVEITSEGFKITVSNEAKGDIASSTIETRTGEILDHKFALLEWSSHIRARMQDLEAAVMLGRKIEGVTVMSLLNMGEVLYGRCMGRLLKKLYGLDLYPVNDKDFVAKCYKEKLSPYQAILNYAEKYDLELLPTSYV